jgi:hypothetical protein
MYCPRWLFLIPGAALILLGIAGYALALPGARVGPVTLGAHTLVYASLAVLCGYQSILFAIFTTTFAVNEGLRPAPRGYDAFYRLVNLERGLLLAALALATGGALLVAAVNKWRLTGFGNLDYGETMRWVVPGATLAALGAQTLFSSFFVSILGMSRR